jgi:hypothetical protein
MPEPLEREIRFDIAPALSALQDLDNEFERSAARLESVFGEAIASALSGITVGDVDAAPVAEAVTEAITEGATTDAVVEGDAAAVEGSVAEAVIEGAADPAVIDADAGGVTEEIDNAVGAADSEVVATADASAVTDEIDNAVSSAEAEVHATADVTDAQAALESLEGTEVAVDFVANSDTAVAELNQFSGAAEGATESTQGLAAANSQLGFATGVALSGTSSLTGTVTKLLPAAGAAGLAIAGLVGFTDLVVEKAASAETATRRLEDAFGDEAEAVLSIDIEGFSGSLSDLAGAAGSSGKKMKGAAADVGVLGAAAGFTTSETAKTAQQILVLAARAVALKPSLGDAGEVAERLQKALASGRDKALIPYGIALDKTAVAAEAAAIATAHGRDAVSVFDKIAAGAAVTSQKLGKTLGEDIQKGAQDAELQMRTLQLQVGAALTEIGKPLVAPFIAILEDSLPIIQAFGQALGEIAEGVLPVLPALLKAVTPPLQLVADLISAIPTPLLTAAAAFAILSRAIPAVQTGIGLLAPGLGALANPIGIAVVGLGALVIALQSFGGESRDAAEEAKTMAESLFGQIESAEGLKESLDKLNSSFNDYIKNTVDLGSESEVIIKAQKELGITNEELFAALNGSDAAFKKFSDSVFDASLKLSDNALIGDEVVKQLKEERENLQAAGEASVRRAVANDIISQSFADLAVKQNTAKDGSVDYVEVLKEIDAEALRVEESQKKVAQAAADSSQEFAALQGKILQGIDVTEEVQAFADQFGIAVEDVKAQLDPLAQKVTEFVTTAVGALPTAGAAFDTFFQTAQDAFKAVGDAAASGETPDKIRALVDASVAAADPARLIEQINKNITAIGDFQKNLQVLVGAGLDNVVQLLVEKGPEVGGALAQALVDNPANAEALDSTLTDLDTAFTNYQSFIQTEGAPLVVGATEGVFLDAAATVPAAYDLASGTTQAFDAAVAAVQAANPKISEETARAAAASDAAFIDRFTINEHTKVQTDAATRTVAGSGIPGAAGQVGAGANALYTGALQLAKGTDAELQLAAQKFFNISDVGKAARRAGEGIGFDFVLGVRDGINNNAHNASQAARELVRTIERNVRDEAHASSPSKLFMEVGEDLGKGLAIGMTKQTAAVADASRQLVAASVGAFDDTALTAPRVAATGGAVAAGGGTTQNTFQFDVDINVNGAMSQADARAAAQVFASEAEVALLRRSVVARVRAV